MMKGEGRNKKKMWECERILSLFLTTFVIAILPGPNYLILASVGSLMGFAKGLRVLAAVSVGFPMMAFFVALGFGVLVSEVMWLSWLLKGVGFVLLFWLAWKIASASFSVEGEEGGRRMYGFWEMFVFQWVNPKAWVMTTTLSSVYLTGEGEVWEEAGVLGLMFFVATVVTGGCWLGMGALIGKFLRHKVWSRVFNVGMALLLLVSVMSVAWGEV